LFVATRHAASTSSQRTLEFPALVIRPRRCVSLEPGDYELRVTVTDRRGAAMAARSASFKVE
jgi:hypothetical protein